MRVSLFIGSFAVLMSAALMIESCTDKGTEPPPSPVSASRTTVNIVPGTSANVQISGGTPPYHITQYPVPQVATASFVDSTVSPATLVIHALSSATIGDDAVVTVGDVDALKKKGRISEGTEDTDSENEVSIAIGIVAVGDISYADDVQPVWDRNCQNRGCHPGGGAPFSLDRFVSWNNLYFATVTNMTCDAIFRVVPFNADSSLVYLTVTGRTSCPRMPFTLVPSDTMSLADQIKIRDWINQGAANN